MRRRCLSTVALLSLLVSIMPPTARADQGRSSVSESLGVLTVKVLGEASRVETFRVGAAVRPRRDGKMPPPAAVDQWLIVAAGKPQGAVFAGRLRALLLDARMYPDVRGRCLLEPGVAFRLWSGLQSVDVILCFHCDDALIVTHDAQGKEVHRVFTSFGALRRPLLALAKEAFPADPQINRLTDKGH